jgi:hypothetical protein
MAALEQGQRGHWQLSLEPWYALLLSTLAPQFIQLSQHGWQEFANGVELEISFEDLSLEEEYYLRSFVENYSERPVLGISREYEGLLPDGPDFTVALGFQRTAAGQTSALAGLLEAYREGQASAYGQLLALLQDCARWLPWSHPELDCVVVSFPTEDHAATSRASTLAQDLTERLAPVTHHAQVCVHDLVPRRDEEQDYIRQWQLVRHEQRLHLSDSVADKRVLVLREVTHHSIGIWGLAGCLKDLGAKEVVALACVKTGGRH